MGSPAGEDGADPDEVLHKVTLSKPFYISKYPITFEQYDKSAKLRGAKSRKTSTGGAGKRPVVDRKLERCASLLRMGGLPPCHRG